MPSILDMNLKIPFAAFGNDNSSGLCIEVILLSAVQADTFNSISLRNPQTEMNRGRKGRCAQHNARIDRAFLHVT